jgi:hypothetical protein
MPPYGMWSIACFVRTDILEEYFSSIFRVKGIREKRTALAVEAGFSCDERGGMFLRNVGSHAATSQKTAFFKGEN